MGVPLREIADSYISGSDLAIPRKEKVRGIKFRRKKRCCRQSDRFWNFPDFPRFCQTTSRSRLDRDSITEEQGHAKHTTGSRRSRGQIAQWRLNLDEL